MRKFIPATDDEIFSLIERFGMDALTPYRVGMPLEPRDLAQATAPERRQWQALEDDTPRRAA